MKAREQEILDFADIGAFIDEPIRHYSSGMGVRLGFAVATSLRPDILITDEVLAVGDESFQQKCVQWIQGYLANGGTLLLSRTACSTSRRCAARRCGCTTASRACTAKRSTSRANTSRTTRRSGGGGPDGAVRRPARACRAWRASTSRPRAMAFSRTGGGLVVRAVMSSPDARPPVALVGIVRADGTPVFGTHSDEGGYRPRPLGNNRFEFTLRIEPLALLPGRYAVRCIRWRPRTADDRYRGDPNHGRGAFARLRTGAARAPLAASRRWTRRLTRRARRSTGVSQRWTRAL
jgi:lipopolysaccharide transport system ATP-binding protein